MKSKNSILIDTTTVREDRRDNTHMKADAF